MWVLWMGLWLRPLVWWKDCFSFLLRRDGGDTRAVCAFARMPTLATMKPSRRWGTQFLRWWGCWVSAESNVLHFESFGRGQEDIPQGLKPGVFAELRGPRLKPWLT
jgi:hypothetical protein